MSSCTLSVARLSVSAALVLTLTSCASLEGVVDRARAFEIQHPVATGVATVVVLGGVAYALDHHHHEPSTNQCKPAGSIWGLTLEQIQTGCK